MSARSISVLMVTSEWPDEEHPHAVPFIVQQVEALRATGVDVEVLPFRGARNPLRYLGAWAALRRRLTERPHDLVHAQFGQSAIVACFPKRLPLVVTFRGDDLEGIVGDDGRYLVLGRILRQVSRLTARRADATIVVSRHLERFLPNRATAVIPSGVDVSVFHPMPPEEARAALGLSAESELVLFVGDPKETRKRVSLAEEAVRLAGRGRLVVVWGAPRDRIPQYMAACDALIFTSMHEGSPNVVKEALACGLPVVSVDVGDVRERLEGVAGCVVCSDDRPQTLAAALDRVLDQGRLAGPADLVADLDEGRLAARVVEIYERVLGRRGPEGARAVAPGPRAAAEDRG